MNFTVEINRRLVASSGRRYLYPLVLSGALAACAFISWTLFQGGDFKLSEMAYLLLIPAWIVGFIALLLQRVDDDTPILSRALWFNLGALTMAVFVPHPLRLLMLAVPFFAVVYAAIYLTRTQVILLAIATAFMYSLGALYLVSFTPVDTRFEMFSGITFAFFLGGVVLLSFSMQQQRDVLLERNHGLRASVERLQDMVLKDDLTGLHNRRSILEVLSRQKALADRGQQAFTLCYCDLDHFKVINDRYGHAVGDVALRQFAELAKATVRNIDYVARFGGEEFLLVLVDADEATANQVTQRLAARTREMWIPGTENDFAMSVSVGIARYRSGERVDDVLSRADHALYAAKRAGRDRVLIADKNS